jgi:ABC-type transport system involved in cytochrome c biogenesis permease subunit
MFGILAVFGIAFLVLWIWSLIHCIQNRYLSDNTRLIGIILIVILGVIGSLVYLFLPRESEVQR